MSYTYHGTTGLVTLPNREVQTFPSGLVRVTRRYVVRKDNTQAFTDFQVGFPLPNDDGAPAIDGLYIYPEPQRITRDDGFVEFRVTAYGRTSIPSGVSEGQETGGGNLNVEETTVKDKYYVTIYETGVPVRTVTLDAIVGLYIIRAVVPSSASVNESLVKPNVTPYVLPISSGIVGEPLVEYNNDSIAEGGVIVFDNVQLKLFVDALQSTTFGAWKEIVVTWKSVGIRTVRL